MKDRISVFLYLGTLIVLKHPYPKKVEEPSIYESVRVHTAMQTGKTEIDLVPNAQSVSYCSVIGLDRTLAGPVKTISY